MQRGRKARQPTTDLVTHQSALPGELDADKDLLDQVVLDINRIYTEKGLETVLAMGQYVLDTFFDGKPAHFHARSGEHATFRELAARDDLHVSYATLWRAVSVVEQYGQFPESVARALPPTHHALLLPLKDEKKKAELARKAVDKGWTKQELEKEVKKVKGSSKAGRPALPRFVKTLHKWNSFLEHDEDSFGDLDALEELDEKDRKP